MLLLSYQRPAHESAKCDKVCLSAKLESEITTESGLSQLSYVGIGLDRKGSHQPPGFSMDEKDDDVYVSDFPATVWDFRLACPDKAVVAFAPLSLSAFWHTGWGEKIWEDAYNSGFTTLKECLPYSVPEKEEDLVAALGMQVTVVEEEVRASLTGANQEQRRTAIAAFSSRVDVRPTYSWSQIILLLKAFDLVLLPRRFAKDNGRDLRTPQELHLPAWKAKGAILAFLDCFYQWPTTLLDFMWKWKEAESMPEGNGSDVTEEAEAHPALGRKAIIRELMRITREHHTRAKLGYVENAFVSAALGLLACTLVSAANRYETRT